MADDEFMLAGLRPPSAAFARRLRARLAEHDAQPRLFLRHGRPLRWAAGFVAVLVVGATLTVPAVRATAEAFLDLFRVVNFAPVAVQQGRLEALLGRQAIDLPKILGQQTDMLSKPPRWERVSSPAAAGARADLPLSLPAWRPAGFELKRIEVLPPQAWRFTANARKLQGVLDSLGIRDVSVPASVDGKVVTASTAPIVRVSYGSGSQHVTVIESRQPVVSIPQGVDLANLADVALRVLGVGSDEAYQLAQSVDWRTTLIVPIPADASLFRQIDVQGHSGLLVVSARTSARGRGPVESRLIWSSADRVFALVGNVPPTDLFDIAQSFQ
jgi:hypothetical protein